jgi:hypothetical protein
VFHILTIADKFLIGGLLLISFASFPLVRWATREGDTVQIEAAGTAYATLALDKDQTLAVPGPLGQTEVVIRNHEVFVQASPCRNKICVHSGPIARSGQFIVCVPNQVVVRVIGTKGQALPYDAITH